MKRKKKTAIRRNIAVHPFVIVAIVATLATVVFLISVYFVRFLR